MGDPKEIEELEAEIARDKKRYSEIERIEAEMPENISHQGFAAASRENPSCLSANGWPRASAHRIDRCRQDASWQRNPLAPVFEAEVMDPGAC